MEHSAFISAEEALQKYHNDKNTIFVDATYGQPVTYTIDGAVFFDIDDIADPHAPFPHTIPDEKTFAEKVSALGISNDNEIIVFDQSGFWMAATRVWWMFRLFGHEDIRILDGGIQKWPEDLSPNASSDRPNGTFSATLNPNLYKSADDIATNDDDFLIVDARPNQAFENGHIPSSVNIPLPTIINNDGTIKDRDTLAEILKPTIDIDMAITTTCGSGVTACALAAAYYQCGKTDVAVFDGSWCEWRSRQDSNLQPSA